MFTCWKNGRPYLQANFRESGRKHPRSICASLGSLDTARERLGEILTADGVAEDDLPALIDRLVGNLEATWSPAAEAQRVDRQVSRLWEQARHPAVRDALLLCSAALGKLYGTDYAAMGREAMARSIAGDIAGRG